MVACPAATPSCQCLDASTDSALDAHAGAVHLLDDADFDEAFYVLKYPDVRRAGMEPYEHFTRHGRAEGRVGRRPTLAIRPGARAVDPDKGTVLIVSHEASRTGAPILSLNIAIELQQRFNVVVLLLGGGDLIDDFCDAAISVVGPAGIKGALEEADQLIAGLCSHTGFDFAIVNSIESRVVLRGLTKASVPSVCLIHEFAAYTRPRDAFPFALQWAAETVFSTQVTYENAIFENPTLANCSAHILPQGRCVPPALEIEPSRLVAERERLKRALRPDDQEAFVIIGAGFVHYRKGVDLFLECAARVVHSPVGRSCRFVWIGSGFDPVNDIGYSAYLAEQVRRAGLEHRVVFMAETPLIDEAYALADVLVLSSRLDPLPNVAIDAMSCGLPMVCFSGGSGIADILEESDLAAQCVAPYHDTAAMADLILNLVSSREARETLGMRLKQVANDRFHMQRYVASLEQLALQAKRRMLREAESAQIIIKSDMMRPDFYLRSPEDDHSLEDVVRYGYVRSWATGIDKRRPRPGFHPDIFLEANASSKSDADPFAAYLLAGQPEGPWNHELILSGDPVIEPPATLRLALHLHVYYPELLPDILDRLGMNRLRPELFVSVPSEKVEDAVRGHLRRYEGKVVEVRVVPNMGRDLSPLLTAFGRQLIGNYDIVGHVHTKKSLDVADEATGRLWHRFLMENLLGGKARMTDVIIGRMSMEPSIGLVFPDDPHIVGWGANMPHAQALANRLNLGPLPQHFVFPVGSMFWARTEAIRPLVDLELGWSDYPNEPLPYDGSMLHAIERLLPMVAQAQSTRLVLTHVEGITR